MVRTPAPLVAQVIGELWSRFPTAHDLASAEADQLAEIIGSLGLRKRAKQLIDCAKAIDSNGFPTNRSELMALPGVGTYVADAVRVFAFGERVIAVDTVVGRTLRRLLGLPSYGPAYDDRGLWQIAQPLANEGDPKLTFAALLDLGAEYCHPTKPSCPGCPLSHLCREQAQSEYRRIEGTGLLAAEGRGEYD